MFFSTASLKNAPHCSKHRKGWLGCKTEEPTAYLCVVSLPHIWALAFLLSLLPAGFIKPEKRRRSPSAPWPCSMGCAKTWDLGERSEACAHPSTAEQRKVKAHQLPPLYLCCVGSAQAVPAFSPPFPLKFVVLPTSLEPWLWFCLERQNRGLCLRAHAWYLASGWRVQRVLQVLWSLCYLQWVQQSPGKDPSGRVLLGVRLWEVWNSGTVISHVRQTREQCPLVTNSLSLASHCTSSFSFSYLDLRCLNHLNVSAPASAAARPWAAGWRHGAIGCEGARISGEVSAFGHSTGGGGSRGNCWACFIFAFLFVSSCPS